MSRPDQSEIIHSNGGTTFVGTDAMNLFRAVTLVASLNFYAKTGMMTTRGLTATRMLKLASEYTGKTYKRGQYVTAAADVRVWVDTMKAAMPVTDNRKEKAP